MRVCLMVGRLILVSSQASSCVAAIASTCSMRRQLTSPSIFNSYSRGSEEDVGRRCQDLKVLGRRPKLFNLRPDPEGELCWRPGFQSSLLHEWERKKSFRQVIWRQLLILEIWWTLMMNIWVRGGQEGVKKGCFEGLSRWRKDDASNGNN